jgi:phage terminase large subunit GpA-like protein
VTRLALVRVPDDAPDPAGLIGWYTLRQPRRYAVVTDATAWEAWVKEHAPEEVWPCGHIAKAFESTVRKWVALHGKWTCPHCTDDEHPDGMDVAPDGMEARQDSASRIQCVTADGVTWESPLDVTEGEAA